MNVKKIYRDKRGRYAKRDARRSLSLSIIDQDSGRSILEIRGHFTEEESEKIKRKATRRIEAIKVEKILEMPSVRGAEKIEQEADGVFKVTIRSAKTRTILHIRKQGNRWQTIRKKSVRA